MTLKQSSAKEIKIIEETISAFYDKLSKSELKNVTIFSDSIRYKDLSEKIYHAVLPKSFHHILEEKLRYHIIYQEKRIYNLGMPKP